MTFDHDLEKEGREFEKLVDMSNGKFTKKSKISNEITDEGIVELLGEELSQGKEWIESANQALYGPRSSASNDIYSHWQSKCVEFVKEGKYDKYTEKAVIEFCCNKTQEKITTSDQYLGKQGNGRKTR